MSSSFTQEPSELEKFIDFFEEDKENIRRVQKFCRKHDLDVKFEVHPKAETCRESAQHSDIQINQIVKTLIFKTGNKFIAILAPGDQKVDTDKIREITGENNVRLAQPKEVEKKTGYIIGGVSPFNLNIPVYMEEKLLKHGKIRPAAGSKIIGAEVNPKDLKKAIKAESAKLV